MFKIKSYVGELWSPWSWPLMWRIPRRGLYATPAYIWHHYALYLSVVVGTTFHFLHVEIGWNNPLVIYTHVSCLVMCSCGQFILRLCPSRIRNVFSLCCGVQSRSCGIDRSRWDVSSCSIPRLLWNGSGSNLFSAAWVVGQWEHIQWATNWWWR